MQEFNFSYDKENDDLIIYNSKSKSKGSVEFGDLILDYNSKKELVGIQMMNASSMIKDMSNKDLKIIKEILSNLESCSLESKQRNNMIIVRIQIVSDKKELTSSISLPTLEKQSPSIAFT